MKRAVRVSLFAIGVLAAGAQGHGQAVVAGLAAYWSLDSIGSLTDSVNGLAFTNNGGATAAAGMFGNAVRLDGTNDSLTAADAPSLNVGTGSFTVALWVRPANTSSVRLVNKWDGPAQQGWLLDIHTGIGGAAAVDALRIRLDSNAAANNTGVDNIDYTTPAALGSGTWKHVAATVDTTANELKLYVNGTQVGTTQTVPDTLGSLSNTFQLAVGTIPTAAGKYTNGDVDEVRLYAAALTLAQVRTLVATAPPVVADPPVAGIGEVALSWAAVAGALDYQVYVSTTPGAGYVPVGGPVTGTSTTVTGLVNGTTHYFVLTADNGVLESANSNEVSATPMLPPPRLKDHDEGTFGDNCACGSSVQAPAPLAGLAALLLVLAARRRGGVSGYGGGRGPRGERSA